MFLIILLLLLLWLFFSKLGLEVKNVKDDTRVIVSFGVFVKIKLDYEKFVKRFNLLNEPSKLNMKVINNYINNIFISRKLYDSLCKNVVIEKLYLYKIINLKTRTLDAFSNTLFFISNSYIKTYINNKFKKVKEEKYLIQRNDYNKNEYDFHVKVYIRSLFLLWVLLKNVKTVFKIFRIKRSKHGSSNKHVTEGKFRKH